MCRCSSLKFAPEHKSIVSTSSGTAEFCVVAAVAEDLLVTRCVLEFFGLVTHANNELDSSVVRKHVCHGFNKQCDEEWSNWKQFPVNKTWLTSDGKKTLHVDGLEKLRN